MYKLRKGGGGERKEMEEGRNFACIVKVYEGVPKSNRNCSVQEKPFVFRTSAAKRYLMKPLAIGLPTGVVE